MLNLIAHVKWFTSETFMAEPSLRSGEWFVVMILVLGGLIAFTYAGKWLEKSKANQKLDQLCSPLRPLVPLIVRLSTTLLLLINVSQEYLLAPNVADTGTTTSGVIMVLFVVAAALIGLGVMTRLGVAAMLAGYLLVYTQADFMDVLDHFEYIGIAGYLWLRGPGVYSFDRFLNGGKLKLSAYANYSLTVYRIGIGIGLALLGLSEKLLNISVAQDFLNQYDWNLLSYVGVNDRFFIIIAGSIELVVGLALILNRASRVLITIVLLIMLTTALLLGIEEVYGHLFAVGAVAVLWVNDSQPKKQD